MNQEEEQRISQLSDSQIRDSFDALFWLSPDQQNSIAETTGDLPNIQTTPPIESMQTFAQKPVVTESPMANNTRFSSTAPPRDSRAQVTTQTISPLTQLQQALSTSLPATTTTQYGFVPSASAMAHAMYNPDALALLTNATASMTTSPAMVSLPLMMTEPIIPQPIQHKESQAATAFSSSSSKKRKSATGMPTNIAFHPENKSLMVCSEDETEQKHRRMDRNAREQHRAQQITQQIATLRDLLMKTSNIQFKPDKFSTLLTAAQYIRQLQKKSQSLAVEHQSLLRTLKKTSESLQRSATGQVDSNNEKVDQLSETFIHQGIPYRVLFQMCPAPMCLVRMDGRFLDANSMFEQLLETKMELLKRQDTTFFNVLERNSIENVFCAMSRLLEVPSALISSDLNEATSGSSVATTRTVQLSSTNNDGGRVALNSTNSKVVSSSSSSGSFNSGSSSGSDESSDQGTKDSFSEDVVLSHNGQRVSLRINIVRSEETQIPRFFACTFSLHNDPSGTTTNASSVSSSTFSSNGREDSYCGS